MRLLFILAFATSIINISASNEKKIYDILVSEDSVFSLSDLVDENFNKENIIDFFNSEREKNTDVLNNYLWGKDSLLIIEDLFLSDFAESPSYHVCVFNLKKDSIYETKIDTLNREFIVTTQKAEKFQIYNLKQEISKYVVYSYICDIFVHSHDSILYIQKNSYDSTTSISLYSLCTFVKNPQDKNNIFRFGFWPYWLKGDMDYKKMKALYP